MHRVRLLLPWMVLSTVAWGQELLHDDFANFNGTIHQRAATPTNIPGRSWSSWYQVGSGYAADSLGAPARSLRIQFTSGTYAWALYPLQSAGGFTKPARLQIEADISLQNFVPRPSPIEGVALGFTSGSALTALMLDGAGTLFLFENDELIDSASLSQTTFNPLNFYHLSFRVDTGSGRLSDIYLNDGVTTYQYALTSTAFTNARTDTLIIGAQNPRSASRNALIDNVRVSTWNPSDAGSADAGSADAGSADAGTPFPGLDAGLSSSLDAGNLRDGGAEDLASRRTAVDTLAVGCDCSSSSGSLLLMVWGASFGLRRRRVVRW